MSGLIIDGNMYHVPGLPESEVLNYIDRPKLKLKMGEDMRMRKTRWVRNVIVHNTKNRKTWVAVGKGPETHLEDRIARLWATDGRHAGAHLSIDWDGTVACHCDLLLHAAYHAGRINDTSIGIELYEDSKGKVYEHQLEVAVKVIDFLTTMFQIQRQIPPSVSNKEISRAARGGKDLVGVFGHCHAYKGKANDPGIHIFEYLETAGYEVLNFWADEDLMIWKSRQAKLGFDPEDCDGVAGPMTVDALQAVGHHCGLWEHV